MSYAGFDCVTYIPLRTGVFATLAITNSIILIVALLTMLRPSINKDLQRSRSTGEKFQLSYYSKCFIYYHIWLVCMPLGAIFAVLDYGTLPSIFLAIAKGGCIIWIILTAEKSIEFLRATEILAKSPKIEGKAKFLLIMFKVDRILMILNIICPFFLFFVEPKYTPILSIFYHWNLEVIAGSTMISAFSFYIAVIKVVEMAKGYEELLVSLRRVVKFVLPNLVALAASTFPLGQFEIIRRYTLFIWGFGLNFGTFVLLALGYNMRKQMIFGASSSAEHTKPKSSENTVTKPNTPSQ